MTVSIPVDDLPGLRTFAAECMGFDPWEWIPIPNNGGMGKLLEGSPWECPEKGDVVPLTTATGFALGVAYGHHKGHCWASCFDAGAPNTVPHPVYFRQMMGHAGDDLAQAVTDILDTLCPKCRGLPYTGESAAMVCPVCNGTGRNPHRAALALRACLLSEVP